MSGGRLLCGAPAQTADFSSTPKAKRRISAVSEKSAVWARQAGALDVAQWWQGRRGYSAHELSLGISITLYRTLSLSCQLLFTIRFIVDELKRYARFG